MSPRTPTSLPSMKCQFSASNARRSSAARPRPTGIWRHVAPAGAIQCSLVDRESHTGEHEEGCRLHSAAPPSQPSNGITGAAATRPASWRQRRRAGKADATSRSLGKAIPTKPQDEDIVVSSHATLLSSCRHKRPACGCRRLGQADCLTAAAARGVGARSTTGSRRDSRWPRPRSSTGRWVEGSR